MARDGATLLIELILVMMSIAEHMKRLSWFLGLTSELMEVDDGYGGWWGISTWRRFFEVHHAGDELTSITSLGLVHRVGLWT